MPAAFGASAIVRRIGEAPDTAGSKVSIADFAILGWAWRHELPQVDLADFPNVKRWYEAIMAPLGTRRGFEVLIG